MRYLDARKLGSTKAWINLTFFAAGFLAGAFLAVSFAFAAVVAARALVLFVVGAEAAGFLSAAALFEADEEAAAEVFFAPFTAGALFCCHMRQ